MLFSFTTIYFCTWYFAIKLNLKLLNLFLFLAQFLTTKSFIFLGIIACTELCDMSSVLHVFVRCRLDLNMDLPQAQTTSVGVASQASQEQVFNWTAVCWCRLYDNAVCSA